MLSPTDIIILRCCRDWPCHAHTAYGNGGKCGLCKNRPVVINEKYPEELYWRNLNKG